MDVLLVLIPLALLLGLVGLLAFLWALKSDQFDDLDGAAHRILFDDEEMIQGREDETSPRDPRPHQTDTNVSKSDRPSGNS